MTVNVDPFTASFTLVMACGLIWLGWKQIGQLREQLVSSLKTSQEEIRTILDRSNATLLPQIDSRYDSPEMKESGSMERSLLEKAMEECKYLRGKTKEQSIRSCFTKYAQDLRGKEYTSYDILMRRCDFFESLGFYCSKEYLLWKDITELYGMPILRTYMLLESHIEDRREKEGLKTYENFVEIARRSKEVYPKYEVQHSIE